MKTDAWTALLDAAVAFDAATDSTATFTSKQLKAFGALMDAVSTLVDEDPTLWCSACLAVTREQCDCGPRPDND